MPGLIRLVSLRIGTAIQLLLCISHSELNSLTHVKHNYLKLGIIVYFVAASL